MGVCKPRTKTYFANTTSVSDPHVAQMAGLVALHKRKVPTPSAHSTISHILPHPLYALAQIIIEAVLGNFTHRTGKSRKTQPL